MTGVDFFSWVVDGRLNDEDPPAPHLSAVMLQAKGEHDAALTLFTNLLTKVNAKENKTNDDLLHIAEFCISIAEIETINESYFEAIKLYKRALNLHIGGSTTLIDGTIETVMIQQDIKAQQSTIAEIYSRLGEILTDEDNISEACINWEKALKAYSNAGLELSNNNADAIFSLSLLKEKQGKINICINLLERCLHIETTIFGEQHTRTDQIQRKLDELRQPLFWDEPNPDDMGCTVESLLNKPPL